MGRKKKAPNVSIDREPTHGLTPYAVEYALILQRWMDAVVPDRLLQPEVRPHPPTHPPTYPAPAYTYIRLSIYLNAIHFPTHPPTHPPTHSQRTRLA